MKRLFSEVWTLLSEVARSGQVLRDEHQQDNVAILCWKDWEKEGVAGTQADLQQRENGCLNRRWIYRLENTATAETVAWQAGTEGGHTLAFSMSNPLSLFTVKKGTNYWGYAVHRNQLPKHTVGVNEKQTQYGPGKMEKWKVFSTVWRRRVESRGWRAFPTEGIEIGIEIGGLLLTEEVYSRKTGFKEPLLLGPKIMNNAQNLTSKLDPANLFLIYVLNFGSVVL